MRIVAVSDFHSGHIQGLTSPNYFLKIPRDSNSVTKKRKKIAAIVERQVWKQYVNIIKSLGHIDISFCVGDLIDGRGQRAGGTELLTTDCYEQCDIAIEALKVINADKYFFVYGTPYHTGKGEDFEAIIADKFHAEISDYLNIKVKKVVFDLKHKMSGSSVFTGKGTGLLKEINSALLWEMSGAGNHVDVCIRGHVHYPFCLFDPVFNKYGFILPALQWSSKYGARQCLGVIALGLLHIDINDKSGEIENWKFHLIRFPQQKVKILIV